MKTTSRYILNIFLLSGSVFTLNVAPLSAQQLIVGTNGNTITYTTPAGYCCAGASLDEPFVGGAGCAIVPDCSTQPARNDQFSCNPVGTHVVYACWYNPNTPQQCESKAVNVTEPAPPSCPLFDLIGGSRVLTHKYGSTDNYPFGQTADAQMTLKLRARRAPGGTTIYLRVFDPPDTAAYGAPHQPDDNQDTSANAGSFSGSKTTQVSLPATGSVSVVFSATDHAAGDNYRVEATADQTILNDPNFICSTDCKSLDITAFKRMYVEMDEMYRNSQLIAARTLVGESVVYVNDRGFRRGDSVRLVHASSYQRNEPQDVDGFYSEDRVIVDVARNNNPNQVGAYAITLDQPLTKTYFTDLKFVDTQLGDAIVNTSRNAQRSSDPRYHSNEQYVSGAFAEAFVEVIKATTSGVGIPFYDAMSSAGNIGVGRKWFAARTSVLIPPNFGLAVAAATRTPLTTANQLSLGTTSGPFSYVWRQNVDDSTSGPKSKFPLMAGLDANIVSGEVLVHELAHQWNVNSTYPDHECNKKSYADSTQFCQGNGPSNSGQYGDGIVKFHYVGSSPSTADSEYMDIRKTGEPKP